MPVPVAQALAAGAAPTLLEGTPLVGRSRAVVVAGGAAPVVSWTLATPLGVAYDLTAAASAELRLRESAADAAVVRFPAPIVDAAGGGLQATLTSPPFPGPGVYDATFAALDGDGRPIAANSFALYCEPSPFAACGGPPRIAEIRLALRDSAPAEKSLLAGSLAFDDAEIALAVTRPIQYWNEIPPAVLVAATTQNFPSRYFWCRGAAAQLFAMAAEYYRANHLPYSAGGVSVDDRAKAPDYEAAYDKYWGEFTAWARTAKARASNLEALGMISSPYGWGAGFQTGY